ncbi:MAG: amino acid ABC transporter ATP-binding protein [Candidatus Sumerlaeaceae bacterium]|nr:amino acid ABC transporter ATP-binding protein [Candidatus Sumerlaeaceae bacterium]
MITLRNLHKRFGQQIVIEDVSLEVQRGETVVLLGPSGSGKTTLLRCINGLEQFDGGEIEVDGILVRSDMPQRERLARFRAIRQKCGYVFQQFNLFPHKTVLQNLMLAPRVVKGLDEEAARQIAGDLLELVGLSEKAGERPHRLSGGEQQRVAIARALAMHPDYLLYDEPTSSLDAARAREIWAMMRQLADAGQTQLIVTHQEELTRSIPCRVVRMSHGRVEEEVPSVGCEVLPVGVSDAPDVEASAVRRGSRF